MPGIACGKTELSRFYYLLYLICGQPKTRFFFHPHNRIGWRESSAGCPQLVSEIRYVSRASPMGKRAFDLKF